MTILILTGRRPGWPHDGQRALVWRGDLEVVEVGGGELGAELEVVAVAGRPVGDPPQRRFAVGRQVDRLGDDAERPQQLAVLVARATGPEREVEDHVFFSL